MKKTIKIENGLVLICGPSSSGKTTLARTIINEAPYHDQILLSHNEILHAFIAERNLPTKLFIDGLPEELDAEFKMCVLNTLQEVLFTKKFIVYESLYCDPLKLNTILNGLPLLGLNRPLTLIKLFPSNDLHSKFLVKKYGVLKNVDMDQLNSQHASFKLAAQPKYFSSNREWIREYTVNDPRNLRLDFKKASEVSKALLASLENFEEFFASFPS